MQSFLSRRFIGFAVVAAGPCKTRARGERYRGEGVEDKWGGGLGNGGRRNGGRRTAGDEWRATDGGSSSAQPGASESMDTRFRANTSPPSAAAIQSEDATPRTTAAIVSSFRSTCSRLSIHAQS